MNCGVFLNVFVMENKRKRGSGRYRDEQKKLKVSGLEYKTRGNRIIPKKAEPKPEVSINSSKNKLN